MIILSFVLLFAHHSLAVTLDSAWPNITHHQLLLPLDHFNNSNPGTWNMTYYKRLDYFKPGGPLYIVCSLYRVTGYANQIGSSKNYFYPHMAEKTNGALFTFKARYTWMSHISNYTKSLEYMTTKQALEDLAVLVRLLRKDYPDSRVVVAGLSYAGSLAVWFRARYPDLADAAYASGAPLLAITGTPTIYETTAQIIKKFCPPSCYTKIKKEYQSMIDCFKTEKCTEELKKKWHLCNSTDLNLKINKQTAISVYADTDWATIQEFSVKSVCETYADSAKLYRGSEFCVDLFNFEDDVAFLKSLPLNRKAQHYSSCREFGGYPVGSSGDQPFGQIVTVDFWLRFCKELFGFESEEVNNFIEETNREFGGLTPNVTKVLFVGAEQDVMRGLQVTSDLPGSKTIFIPGSIPYADVRVNPWHVANDTVETLEARKVIMQILQSWIAN